MSESLEGCVGGARLGGMNGMFGMRYALVVIGLLVLAQPRAVRASLRVGCEVARLEAVPLP